MPIGNAFAKSLRWVIGLIVASVSLWLGQIQNHSEGWAFDLQQRAWNAVAPPAPTDRIVIIGIDDASLALFPEPMALWHRHLAQVLQALAVAKPVLVGVDVVLPARSYEAVNPGGDLALVTALVQLREASALRLTLGLTGDGRVAPVHTLLVGAAGAENFGLAWWPRDHDGVVRRYRPLRDGLATVPLFFEKLAEVRGYGLRAGYIDASAVGPFAYLPFHEVVTQSHDPAWMRARFQDRTVLIGGVLPFEDVYPQPLNPAAWTQRAHGEPAPGVLLYAKALAALETEGTLIQPVPWAPGILVFCAVVALLSLRTPTAAAVAMTAIVGLWLGSWAGVKVGFWFDPLNASGVITAAWVTWALFRAGRQVLAKRRLELAFGGYVSPVLLQDIVSGRLDPNAIEPRPLALLFIDLRDSVTLTRQYGTVAMVGILNDFFAEVTRILHAHGATIDNFRGDGVLAFFGAPRALADPATAALTAALEIDRARQAGRLTRRIGEVRLAMGLALGEAVAANVGGARNNYTAIGEPVNLAARLQEVGKGEGIILAMDAAAAAAVVIPQGYRAEPLRVTVRSVGDVTCTVIRQE
jgi:adenylate cyclase